MRRVLQEKKKDFLCVVKPTKNLRFCKVMSLTGEKEQASCFRKVTMYPSTTPWSPSLQGKGGIVVKKTQQKRQQQATALRTISEHRPEIGLICRTCNARPYEPGSINGVGDDVLDVPLKMHKINGKIISSPMDTPESVSQGTTFTTCRYPSELTVCRKHTLQKDLKHRRIRVC